MPCLDISRIRLFEIDACRFSAMPMPPRYFFSISALQARADAAAEEPRRARHRRASSYRYFSGNTGLIPRALNRAFRRYRLISRHEQRPSTFRADSRGRFRRRLPSSRNKSFLTPCFARRLAGRSRRMRRRGDYCRACRRAALPRDRARGVRRLRKRSRRRLYYAGHAIAAKCPRRARTSHARAMRAISR